MNVRSTANTSSKATLWKVFILILAIIVNVVLASRLLWGPQSLVSYRELASQYAELLKERDGFDVVNAGLSREIRLLQSDEKYVEKMIRQRLNFVRSNEILYLFTEDANARGPCLMMEKIEWYQKSSSWTLIPRFFSRWRSS